MTWSRWLSPGRGYGARRADRGVRYPGICRNQQQEEHHPLTADERWQRRMARMVQANKGNTNNSSLQQWWAEQHLGRTNRSDLEADGLREQKSTSAKNWAAEEVQLQKTVTGVPNKVVGECTWVHLNTKSVWLIIHLSVTFKRDNLSWLFSSYDFKNDLKLDWNISDTIMIEDGPRWRLLLCMGR